MVVKELFRGELLPNDTIVIGNTKQGFFEQTPSLLKKSNSYLLQLWKKDSIFTIPACYEAILHLDNDTIRSPYKYPEYPSAGKITLPTEWQIFKKEMIRTVGNPE